MQKFFMGHSPSLDIIDAGDILIVGAGISALTIALKCNRPVSLLSDQPLGVGGSTLWAQGGIAAALGEHDNPEIHVADTLRAASHLANESAVRYLAYGAQEAIQFLLDLGVPFDRNEHGQLIFGLEGAHTQRRIVKIKGDQTGPLLMKSLIEKTLNKPYVHFFEPFTAFELYLEDGRVRGIFAHHSLNPSHIYLFRAREVILCTGGIGHLYRFTTNPPQARGDGLAMALRAGARVENLEFVQFHPTALVCNQDPAPLLTEAIRGEGAYLVNERGERFMQTVSPFMELAARDVIAQTMAKQINKGHKIFLDARSIKNFSQKFPFIQQLCKNYNLCPERDLLPIAPAAHYHMGGIQVDLVGKTTLKGLRACGEVASTGVHGANRLASNSLLEALVYGTALAHNLEEEGPHIHRNRAFQKPPVPTLWPGRCALALKNNIRQVCQTYVGVLRHEAGLKIALEHIQRLQRTTEPAYPLTHFLLLAERIAACALDRKESCGSHYREDTLKPSACA